MQCRRRFLIGVAGGLLAVRPAQAAPAAELWPRWQAHGTTGSIDHGDWDGILKAYVVESPDGINRVAYGRVSAADRAVLDRYLDRLAASAVDTLNRAEQRAYWINLYNALTLRVVLDHYPVASIRDIRISPGLFSIGPWGRKLVRVQGEEVSLDDIEHRILRPIWRDPRLHYAVNCAALGCPNLMREAYTADNCERLLEAGASAYVNHPRGADIAAGRLRVSSIFVWFIADFGGNAEGVIAHLRRYAGVELAQALATAQRIADDRYDWTLNDTR